MADVQEPLHNSSEPSTSSSPPPWPSLSEFYAGKSIFLTGATGFMGKCLLEKILRDLPEVERIYILIRPKKDKSIEERVEAMSKLKLYEKIIKDNPDTWNKIVPLSGDIGSPRLGLSEEDAERLFDNVSIVLHLAATVQFNAPLQEAIQYNVSGVQEMIKLCRRMKKLESFVHVSTAYSFCQKRVIDEAVYQNEVHYKKVLNLLDWFKEDMWNTLSPSLLEGRPNTYTYSKSLGEHVITEEAADLPVAILRPSIIGAAVKDPLPGWIDVFHGPGGLFVATGKGLLRVLRADINGKADIVPVDFVNNMLLSIGWVTAMKKSNEIKVYHCNTGTQNPITWIELYPYVIKSYSDNPFDWIFHRPRIYLCRPAFSWPVWHLFLHTIPAYVVDFIFTLMGRKAMLVRIYSKLRKAVEQLDYFTQNSWEWSNDNGNHLRTLMSEDDQRLFNFDPLSLKWSTYVANFCMGTKKYLLKDDPNNLSRARRQIQRLRNIRYMFNLLMFLLATRLVYIRSQIAREVWSSFLGMCLLLLRKLGFPTLQYNLQMSSI